MYRSVQTTKVVILIRSSGAVVLKLDIEGTKKTNHEMPLKQDSFLSI